MKTINFWVSPEKISLIHKLSNELEYPDNVCKACSIDLHPLKNQKNQHGLEYQRALMNHFHENMCIFRMHKKLLTSRFLIFDFQLLDYDFQFMRIRLLSD